MIYRLLVIGALVLGVARWVFAAGGNFNDTSTKAIGSLSPTFVNAVFSGNTGIGTTAPQTLLAIVGGNVGIGTWTAAGGNLIVNGNGNVGIGSAWPGSRLDIDGLWRMTGFQLTGNNAGNGNVLVSNGVGVGTWMASTTLPSLGGTPGGSSPQLQYNNGGAFGGVPNSAVNSNGNIGLGTTLSANVLDVGGSLGVGIGTLYAGYQSAPPNGLIVQGNVGIGTGIAANGGLLVMNGNVGIGTWVPSDLFQVNNGSHAAFLIDSNGNVGAGTTQTSYAALSVMNGNVGINTFQPFFLTQIGAVSSNNVIVFDGNGNIGIGTIDTSQAKFVQALSGQNAGIGTANPQTVLAVYQNNPVDAPIKISGNSTNYTVGVGFSSQVNGHQHFIGHKGSSSYVLTNNAFYFADLVTFDDLGNYFGTNNLQRMWIGSNVGIGTVTSKNNLDVGGAVAIGSFAGVDVAPSNGMIVSGNVGIGTFNANFGGLVVMNGNVGIGTWVPKFALQVVGTAGLSTSTSWTNASDGRLKDIWGDYKRGLNDILKLHTIRYRYKKNNALGLPSDHETIGFIAQEVQKVIPEAVGSDAQGYLNLNVDPIHWAMVNAIREFAGKVENSDDLEFKAIKSLEDGMQEIKNDQENIFDDDQEINKRIQSLRGMK